MRLRTEMKGVEEDMYMVLGVDEDVRGEGMGGCRRGRF